MEKQNKFCLLLSGAAFCVLLLRPLAASFVIAPAVTLLLAGVLPVEGSLDSPSDGKVKAGLWIASALLSLFFAAVFLAVWLRTKRMVSLQFFQWQKALPLLLTAAAATVGAVPFLERLLKHAIGYNAILATRDESYAGEVLPGLTGDERRLLFCVALVSVSVCSLSSPLYPFNDWVDANCFFTVGKSMLYGMVPYRDLYEQKGPLLYALYALCYPISRRSFLGGWILEILASWWFLSLAWKSHRLLTGKRDPLFLFLTAALVYTAPSFLKGGSAEELSMPLVMLSFYYGLRCVCKERDFTSKEAFLIGLSSGAVLWIKYSMLGFYLGFILVPGWRMLHGGRWGRLLKLLGLVFLGVAVSSAPVLAYFGYHHALSSLWEAYFYNNIFVYGKASSIMRTMKGLASGMASMLTYNDATILLVLFSVWTLWREKNKALAVHALLSFGFAFGLIYAGGINLKYYSEILCLFIPLGVTQLLKFCSLPGKNPTSVRWMQESSTRRRLGSILIPILFTMALFGSENSGMLLQKRSEMPQFIFAETLQNDPDATLFNYGALDIGLFTTADIVPTTRYFCMLNLPSEEMVSEMERYMREGTTKYIVSRGLELDSPCYRLLDTVLFPDSGTVYPYYLYVRQDDNTELTRSSS